MQNKKMTKENKIALITGANAGIGKELSILISSFKYHVLLLGRNLNRLKKVNDKIKIDNGISTIVNLDLQDFKGIDRLGLEIFKKFNKLDLLILNAGILGTLGPITHQEPEEFEEVIKINLIANFRLIRSLEPLLKKSKKANIIFISSGAAHGSRAYWGAYSVSKAALEQLANIWSAETKKSNIKIHIINPGATRTEMRAKAMPGENPKSIQTAEMSAKKIINQIKNDL
mgnify:CR=1 FL=1